MKELFRNWRVSIKPKDFIARKGPTIMQPPDPRQSIVTHLPALRAFAISLTRNHALADDMVQDTILKAWTQIDKFQQGTKMRAWLFTILRNTYYSHRRKRAREVQDVDQIYTDTLVTKPAHDGTLQMRDFYRALSRLPAAQRETLILLGAAGYSHDEVAEICGVAPGTIKSRANRARRRLAELMNLEESGPVPLTDAATRAIVGG